MDVAPASADAAALSELLGADPLPWVLSSDEPYARWVILRSLLGKAEDDPAVADARAGTLGDEGVRWLAETIPVWGDPAVDDPAIAIYAPNRLNLLADMGVRGGDFSTVEDVLDEMLAHQEASGRFRSIGSMPRRPKPAWGSLLCDTAAITEVMVRFDRGADPRVRAAIQLLTDAAAQTSQGSAWLCLPEDHTPMIGGPARPTEPCPQVTLENIRLLSMLAPAERPADALDYARAPLEAWRRRESDRPCGFGHGYQFKTVKWPNLWYDVLWVLETVGRFPELWSGPTARAEDRRAIAELAACLMEYNLDVGARVTPRRAYRGYERFSFGRKDAPSPFATARCVLALSRLTELTDDIRSVDVEALPSTRDNARAAVAPRRSARLCPISTRIPAYSVAQARARVLTRHRIGVTWESASLESLTSDVTALNATAPTSPYLAYAARFADLVPDAVDHARFDLHSLVTLRAMRGWLCVMRADFAPVAFSATRRQTTKYAREYSEQRGVTRSVYLELVPAVLDLLGAGSLSSRDIRARLRVGPGVDVAALVNRMVTEGTLTRDRLEDGWAGHRWTFGRTEDVLPGIDLHALKEEEADAALTRAYLRSFAPATDSEASWWTGLGPRRTERALITLGDEITTVRLHGVDGTFMLHASDLDDLAAAALPSPLSTALLPAYDPLMMGYAAKDRFVSPADRSRVFDATGGSAPVVIQEGVVVGVWDYVAGEAPAILVHLFSAADADSVEHSASGVSRFIFGREVPVRFVDSAPPVSQLAAGAVRHPLRP